MNPTTYTPERAAEILKRVAEGEPTAVICRSPLSDGTTVAKETFRDWRKVNEDLETAYRQAKRDGHDAIVERARKTARGKDEAEGGESTKDVQRDKLIVELDLKLLAKWDPKRWGDKIDLNHRGTVKTVSRVELVALGIDDTDNGATDG